MKGIRISQVLSTAISMAVVGAFGLATASPAAAIGGEARIHGKTYGEWSARWWLWQQAYYPQQDFGEGVVDCSFGQKGVVWFLGSGFTNINDPEPVLVERTCEDPLKRGTHLFIPLVNTAVVNTFDQTPEADYCGGPCTIKEKRDILNGIFNEIYSEKPASPDFNFFGCHLTIDVDGDPAVFSSPIVRTQSPPFEYFGTADYETGDLVEIPDPETIADGFWVMLAPLPKGDHTIEFTGGLCDVETGDLLVGVGALYDVTVK